MKPTGAQVQRHVTLDLWALPESSQGRVGAARPSLGEGLGPLLQVGLWNPKPASCSLHSAEPGREQTSALGSPLPPRTPAKVQPVDMAWGDWLRETARPVSLAVLPTCVSPCWPPLPFSLSHHLCLTKALPPSLIMRKPGDPAKGFPLPPSSLGWEVNEAAIPNSSGEKNSS